MITEFSKKNGTNVIENAVLGCMKELYKNSHLQNTPMTGLFFYDPLCSDLYGIDSHLSAYRIWNVLADGRKYKFADKSHEQFWMRESKRSYHEKSFDGDFNTSNKGIVVESEKNGMIIVAGSWLGNHPDAVKLVVNEFQLPEDVTVKISRELDMLEPVYEKILLEVI